MTAVGMLATPVASHLRKSRAGGTGLANIHRLSCPRKRASSNPWPRGHTTTHRNDDVQWLLGSGSRSPAQSPGSLGRNDSGEYAREAGASHLRKSRVGGTGLANIHELSCPRERASSKCAEHDR